MKRLVIGVVVLVVLLVGGFSAAVITLNSIDWSEYEEPIAAAVKDATGRELHFSGALNVNISLSPGISAQGITLQNADWASREDMLSLDHVEVHMKLLPLIFGRIELSRLEIIGLNLSLETDRQGKGNWEFELAGGEAPVAAEPASGDDSLLTAAVLTRAVIRDAAVSYTDGETGESQRFSIVEFIARMDSVSAPLIIDLEASYGSDSVELAGEIDGLQDLLAGGALDLDLTVGALGATVLIDGTVGKPLEADGIEIAIEVSGDSLGRLAEFADVQVTGLGAYRVTANISGNAESMAVADLDVGLEAAGARVQATGAIGDAIAVTGIDIDLGVKGDSLASLSPLIDAEMPALGAYRFAANIAGTAERFDITNLSIGLADTQIEGRLNADIATEPMRIRASLNSQKIDLTRLLPVEEAAGSQPTGEGESGERLFSDDPLPLDVFDALETIDAIVDVAIRELIIDPETTVSNLGIKVTAVPGKVSINPLKLDVMGGSVGGYVDLGAGNKAVEVDAQLNISHPSAGDIVTDDDSKMLTGGPLDMKISIAGNGASIREIMASSNGFVNVELGAARANSRWMRLIFAQMKALLTKRAMVPVDDEPLELHCLVTDFKISNGIARAESVVVDARGISFFGAGSIDLGTEALDLNFDWLAEDISNKTTLPAIKLRGTLMSPSGKLDTKKAIGNLLGLGDGAVTESDFEASGVTAESGPERCRQRLIVYEQIREERSRPKEVTVDSLKNDVDTVKEALKNLGGLFRKKR